VSPHGEPLSGAIFPQREGKQRAVILIYFEKKNLEGKGRGTLFLRAFLGSITGGRLKGGLALNSSSSPSCINVVAVVVANGMAEDAEEEEGATMATVGVGTDGSDTNLG